MAVAPWASNGSLSPGPHWARVVVATMTKSRTTHVLDVTRRRVEAASLLLVFSVDTGAHIVVIRPRNSFPSGKLYIT